MTIQTIKDRLFKQFHLTFTLKWLVISLIVGSLAGSASALFLISLNHASEWREANRWIIYLLPIGGILIGAMYHYLGQDVVKGNNQLLEEIEKPKNIIPLKMAPLVLLGTVLTHLFGGSAGREGTAVQMGGAIADQFSKIFKLDARDRRILIVCGISAGFASVFGTPLAGTVFALEVLVIGSMRYDAILPSVFSAVIANYICELWPVTHTHYHIGEIPNLNGPNLLWAIIAGIAFGLASLAFSGSMHKLSHLFKKYIKSPLLRPFVGGLIILGFFLITDSTRFLGLGVPVIVESFTVQQPFYAFALKIALTTLTLSAGFKGGEVTPLFFIGATLGSALSMVLPLPVGLLAGMGFVAVFSGAANTPIACVLMGIELFGAEGSVYIAVACFMAYIFSGHTGIYTSQIVGQSKHPIFMSHQNRRLNEL